MIIIFVMDKSNFRDVIKLAKTPQEIEKVSLILDSTHPGQDKEVPDPITGVKMVLNRYMICFTKPVRKL